LMKGHFTCGLSFLALQTYMRVLKFRVLLDNIKGVFRDIEIPESYNLAELHEAVIDSLEFSGMEMASFFVSDEDWEKGEEISLMDMSEPGQETVRLMSETPILDVTKEVGDRLLYVYDFLNMWICYVELVDILDKKIDKAEVVLSVGDSPIENSASSESLNTDFDDSDLYEDFEGDEIESEFESLDDHPDI